MLKENIRELAYNVASRVYNRTLSHNLATVLDFSCVKEGNCFLEKMGLSWLQNEAAAFYLHSKQVQIITDPPGFYSLLLEKCRTSSNRIVLSALYLGTGAMEAKLVECMSSQLKNKPDLKVRILLDCTRGSRGAVNSRKMLLPLLESHRNACQVSLYHTPALRGPLLSLIPNRYNELIGVQHIKCYLFDNDVIISGANLSHDYFTHRQDRYIVINNCKKLADFVDGLVKNVSDFSLQLTPQDELKLSPDWKLHPTKSNYKEFVSAANKHVWSFYSQHLSSNSSLVDEDCDTAIFPLLEMGQMNIHQDSSVTKRLMSQASQGTVIHLATGYFNLTQGYVRTILHESTANFYLLMAHPSTNGFYKARGPAGGVPNAYTELAKQFFNKVKNSRQYYRIKMMEYQRAGWTYHAKGLWLTDDNKKFPSVTFVGSPNFGERSVHRDLECQFVLTTTSHQLQQDLSNERENLYKLSKPFTQDIVDMKDRRTPFWVKVVVFLFRNFL